MLNQNISNKTNGVTGLDLVFINEKEVMTDSLLVAKSFKKSHKNVLADIREIITHLEGFGGRLKFQPSEYTNKQGKKFPKFVMDKDAFLMLVMGYRGAKAVEIRYRYIQAFNAMYEYIQNNLKSKQDKHFEAVKKFTTRKAEMSWHATRMRQWQDEAPLLLEEVENTLKDMQGSIDFSFTDNEKIH